MNNLENWKANLVNAINKKILMVITEKRSRKRTLHYKENMELFSLEELKNKIVNTNSFPTFCNQNEFCEQCPFYKKCPTIKTARGYEQMFDEWSKEEIKNES